MSTAASVIIRKMFPADMKQVLEIQDASYPEHMTDPHDLILERTRIFSETNFVAEMDGDVVGYIFAYPTVLGHIGTNGGMPEPELHADTMYIHDCSVSEKARGMGLAKKLLDAVVDLSVEMGLKHMSLVAVLGAVKLWGRYGFEVATHKIDDDNHRALMSYGDSQQEYMERVLVRELAA